MKGFYLFHFYNISIPTFLDDGRDVDGWDDGPNICRSQTFGPSRNQTFKNSIRIHYATYTLPCDT